MTDMTKQAFIDRLRIERVKWLALLDEVPPERRAEPGVVGQWSAHDLVAHLAVWETWGANVAHAIREGRAWSNDELFAITVPADVAALDFDAFNVWLTERYAGRSYAQVCGDERAAYWRFIEAFEQLDAADLPKPSSDFPVIAAFGGDTLWELMANQTFSHYDEHAKNVRAWLAANRASTGGTAPDKDESPL